MTEIVKIKNIEGWKTTKEVASILNLSATTLRVFRNQNKKQFEGLVMRSLSERTEKQGGDDARKDIIKSSIDEPPRLLPLKNKAHKSKSKPKPKKRAPKIKAFKRYKEDAKSRGLCDYCGVYIKIRHTSNFIHINIRQNSSTHYFCSKECKINWIFVPVEKKNIIREEKRKRGKEN